MDSKVDNIYTSLSSMMIIKIKIQISKSLARFKLIQVQFIDDKVHWLIHDINEGVNEETLLLTKIKDVDKNRFYK